MKLLRSCALAFLTFSRIPLPQVDWEPEGMRYTMCFFPLVGVVVGLLVGLWAWACGLLGLDSLAMGLGITAVPLLVTGGIHMDGFCDTVDAQASRADPAKKRAILKDPHAGAFAVVGTAVYVLGYFVFAENLRIEALGPGAFTVLFVCLHALSRSLSSIATVAFPLAGTSGMLAAERASASRRPVLVCCVVLACLCAVGLVMAWPAVGAAMVLSALACLAFTRAFALRQFGGMSGDIAGFFLQIAELAMLICLSVGTKVVF